MHIRTRVCRACAAALLLAAPAVHALTLKVGPSAGQSGSACQFRTPQEAIDSLPRDSVLHTIELETSRYFDADGTIDIDDRRVKVVTRYRAGSQCRNEEIFAPAELIANNTTLPGGRTVVVRNGGSLTLDTVNVFGNQSGGLLVRDSRLELQSAIIANHSTPASSSGGGIVIEGGFLAINASRINSNVASANGGAIFCTKGSNLPADVSIDNETRILNNIARRGGGIYQFRGCKVRISGGSVLENNIADFEGGAIATDSGALVAGQTNSLELLGRVDFLGNAAGSDGGAISLTGRNTLSAGIRSLPVFTENTAVRFGGAIDIANENAQGALKGAQFLRNEAGRRGGAVSVRQGILLMRADCAEQDTVNENYCAVFDGNKVENEGNQERRGGALDLDGGTLSVEGFAFRNSTGPATVTADSGGVIAYVNNGFLRVANSLVFDSTAVTEANQHLFLINSGRAQFSFNTMVGLPAGSVIFTQPGSAAELVGNIIADNNAGVVDNGNVSGTCNSAQLGSDPAPLDPKFVTTAGGRFRLAADSAMIGRGLTCNPNRLPDDYQFPVFDLDGNPRILIGEQEQELDLGAFEFQIGDDVLFSSGFESVASPRPE